MKKPHVTIHDIAKELNVSASTVSRALQNHPRISESTRTAVQKMAEQYNYQPNVAAASSPEEAVGEVEGDDLSPEDIPFQ